MKTWKLIIFISSLVLICGILLNSDCVADLFLSAVPNVTAKDSWGTRNINDKSITEIIIKVPVETLNNLFVRIRNRVSAPSFSNSNFQYGFNVEYLDKMIDYWLNKYNWEHWESVINRFPHRFTTIKGLQIHYIHVKPIPKPNQKIIPILLLHGWPGSFFEFYKLIPLLSTSTEKDQYAFEIVCPSLVGYGWSDGATIPGFDIFAMSDVMFALMERLNITSKFYIQGGDFGFIIARSMSVINPKKVAGIHINFVEIPFHDMRYLTKVFIGSMLPAKLHFLTQKELVMVYPWSDKINTFLSTMGYFGIQSTRPSTIGIALSDSPAGLAAYILEKFGAWSNNNSYHLSSPNGGLEDIKISKDELLTNVMIYYITNSISSSIRLYKEMLNEQNHKLFRTPVHVPTAIAMFPNEMLQVPKPFVHFMYRNVRQFNYMPRGGHFAALEEPELLANDIRSFINLMENY